MQRVTHDRSWPLFDVAATRRIETAAAAKLPPHTLMERAGDAVARLALAIAPHARTVWIACGPGNNGGDGLEAAMRLQQLGKEAVVTWLGNEETVPGDALASLNRARDAAVTFVDQPVVGADLVIDALLGIGPARPLRGAMQDAVQALNLSASPVLAIDIPTGLNADTGEGIAVRATHTLSLLGLKPGLFTGQGRDAAGEVWTSDLGIRREREAPSAWLAGPPLGKPRAHASHKGSYGDVAVIGGAPGMTGAALLAATAALRSGAGRVYVGLLDEAAAPVSFVQPELMFRAWDSLDVSAMAVAAGCGGAEAIRGPLPKLLSSARSLVVDADGLNAIAADSQLVTLLEARGRRGTQATVITPHPLEAARLLEATTPEVQSGRLACARELMERFRCVVVLKGSGTIIAAPDQPLAINPTGSARLATAGTGDVLAGMVAARLARGDSAYEAARNAVYEHGAAADAWPAARPLTASLLP